MRSLGEVAGLLAVVLGGLASIATNLADDEKGKKTESQGLITCQSETDCGEHEATPHCLASYGLCVECLSDAHCGAQERCLESRCAARCSSSASCEGELVCLDGLCRECRADADCGDPAQYCYQGEAFSACRPLCTSSAECTGPGYAAGDVCRGGRCGVVECAAAQDCLVDREVCDPAAKECRPLVR